MGYIAINTNTLIIINNTPLNHSNTILAVTNNYPWDDMTMIVRGTPSLEYTLGAVTIQCPSTWVGNQWATVPAASEKLTMTAVATRPNQLAVNLGKQYLQ